jgi:hypothetical protein
MELEHRHAWKRTATHACQEGDSMRSLAPIVAHCDACASLMMLYSSTQVAYIFAPEGLCPSVCPGSQTEHTS